jgi:lipoate-protein ligase B
MINLEPKKLYKVYLGQTKFRYAWDLQKRLVDLRSEGRIPDILLLTEHEPVITMGRGTAKGNLLVSSESLRERGVDIYEIERGGDITFHGPGQLVAYPIIDLHNRGRDLHKYLRDLEILIIDTLGDLGLEARTKKGLTGVWVGDHKLAAIGVAVSRWITYHGLALNVNTDMDNFKLINPCGITEYPVGSVSQILGREMDMKEVADLLAKNFARLFEYEIEDVDDIDSVISENATI